MARLYESLPTNRAIITVILGILVLSSLIWSLFTSPLFFLSLSDVFIVLMELAAFVIVWASHAYIQDATVLWLGTLFIFTGFLDLGHLVTGTSSGVLPQARENISTQFWLAARTVQTAAILSAPFIARRKSFNQGRVMGIAFLIVILLTTGIVVGGIIPNTHLPGVGYTPFFSISSLLLAALSLFSFWLIYTRRGLFDAHFYPWLILSIAASTLGMVLSGASRFPTELNMLLSHFFIVIAFFSTLIGLVDTGITQPFESLFQDINAARSRLQQETDFVSAILNTTSVLLVVLNEKKQITQINRVTELVTGYTQRDIQNRFAWETMLFSSDPVAIQSVLEAIFEEKSSTTYEGVIIDLDNNERHITWTVTWLSGPKHDNYVVCTGVDMTERKQTEDELRFVSTHDVLTGLYNRSFFEAEIVRIAETDHFPTSIVIADVDGLKMINDTFGHVVGDVWLQRAANALRSAFRAEDIVARIGGDEFAVLLTDADESVADHAQRRVREILAAHNLQNPGYKISISLGSATAEAGYMLMETFKKADQAMYREKASHQSHSRKPRRLSRR